MLSAPALAARPVDLPALDDVVPGHILLLLLALVVDDVAAAFAAMLAIPRSKQEE